MLLIYGSVVAPPFLGMMVGAVAGRFTPRVSAGLGAVIGFVSGGLGIGSTILVFWMLDELGCGLPPRNV